MARVHGRFFHQHFPQHWKIAVRVADRQYAFMHLTHMNASPGNLFSSHPAQHGALSATPAHCDDESSARRESRASIFGDNGRRPLCDGIRVRHYLNLHTASGFSRTNRAFTVGLCRTKPSIDPRKGCRQCDRSSHPPLDSPRTTAGSWAKFPCFTNTVVTRSPQAFLTAVRIRSLSSIRT